MTSIERDHRCIGNEVVEQGLGADIVVLRCHSGRAEWALPRGCREDALRRLRGDGPQAREAHRLSRRHGERTTCGKHERMSAMMRRSLGKEVLMKQQPTLFLTVGLPCTGKTTAARRIEIEQRALRLTKDEWVKALYGHENPPPAQNVIEGRLIQIGLRVLELGTSVVLDYGLWGRDERSALRQAAADLGAVVEMRYFELAPAEQRRRLDRRSRYIGLKGPGQAELAHILRINLRQ